MISNFWYFGFHVFPENIALVGGLILSLWRGVRRRLDQFRNKWKRYYVISLTDFLLSVRVSRYCELFVSVIIIYLLTYFVVFPRGILASWRSIYIAILPLVPTTDCPLEDPPDGHYRTGNVKLGGPFLEPFNFAAWQNICPTGHSRNSQSSSKNTTRYTVHGRGVKPPKLTFYALTTVQKNRIFITFFSDLTPRTSEHGFSRFQKSAKKSIQNWSWTDRYYSWTKQFVFFSDPEKSIFQSTSRQRCLTTPLFIARKK